MTKNVILASFAFMGMALAQNTVNPTFLWDAAIDTEGRVITGSADTSSGWWFEYTDVNNQGTSEFVYPEGVEENAYNNFFGPLIEECGGIKAEVHLKDGYEYPFVGLGFNVGSSKQEGVNIKAWNGMCITYESTMGFGLELAIENEAEVTKYDNFKANVNKAASQTTVNFPWTKFKQGKWGIVIDQDSALAKIATIKLKFDGAAGTTGDFKITKLGSFCQCSPEASECSSSAIRYTAPASSAKATLSGRMLEFTGTTSLDKATIVDLQGKVVKSATATTMDLSALKAGMYMLRIEGPSISHLQTIILK